MGNNGQIRQEWERQLDKLPALMNIARVSLLISLLTFHVLLHEYGALSVRMATEAVSSRFYVWAVVYGSLIVLSMFIPQWQKQSLSMPNIRAVVDITMMAILMHIEGSIGSGFGILILPFVVTSCLLSYGRYPILYASYAALLLLLSWFFQYWPFQGDEYGAACVQGVVLVASCYLIAILTSFSATFLNRASIALLQHRRAFDRLKGLNELVLNYVNEAVVVVDTSSRIWLLNRQAQNYFPVLLPDSSGEMFSVLVQRWQRDPQRSFATHTEIAQQSVQVRARPLIQDDVSLLMLFIRSSKDLAEEAMATKLTSLGQLTANLAHEIRNPLSAIRQSNGLLAEEDEDPVSTKLRGIIDNNVARIDKMLEEVSSLNKSDRINAENINLMRFWLDFKHEFLLTRPEARHSIHFNMTGGPLVARFDKGHLQQILWNLMNNAWRHSQQDNEAIQVLVKPVGNVEISLIVVDNGAGVSAENRLRLFEPFFTTQPEGTGLGLYVARELAHANMGQLYYHPEIKGFELVLPREIS